MEIAKTQTSAAVAAFLSDHWRFENSDEKMLKALPPELLSTRLQPGRYGITVETLNTNSGDIISYQYTFTLNEECELDPKTEEYYESRDITDFI